MDEFIYPTEEDAKEIAKYIKSEYVGLSRVDGRVILTISNTSYWYFYRKFIRAELVESMYETGNVISFTMKILEHNPKLFQISLREEKLKRIINI